MSCDVHVGALIRGLFCLRRCYSLSRIDRSLSPLAESLFGPRGPGTNVMNELLMPHLAKIHPVLRERVCEQIAGYKTIDVCSHTGGLGDRYQR